MASLTLTREGRVTVDIAVHEMGMGTSTVQTQITAKRLGLPMENVFFNYGDSTLPGVIMAGGAQQTAAIGASVLAAYTELVKELLVLAGNDSPLAGLKPGDVANRDAGLFRLAGLVQALQISTDRSIFWRVLSRLVHGFPIPSLALLSFMPRRQVLPPAIAKSL